MLKGQNHPYANLSQKEAQDIATRAFYYLAQDNKELGRFLALSGLGPQTIRKAVDEPDFLIGILEYMMENEALLLACTKAQGLRPTMIAAAHCILTAQGPTPPDVSNRDEP